MSRFDANVPRRTKDKLKGPIKMNSKIPRLSLFDVNVPPRTKDIGNHLGFRAPVSS
jgi:hypothetical protein